MSSLSRHRIDFIVGVFVLVALVGVVFVALRAANITDVSGNNGYVVQINFDNIGSLVERSPVKSSGVRVGRVQRIIYDGKEHIASVYIVINEHYHFPTDSIFSVVSSNLLGGQYISIDVGGEEAVLQPNAIVQGNSAIVLEDLISQFLFDKAGE